MQPADFSFELRAFTEIMQELDDPHRYPPDVVAQWVPDLVDAAADDLAQLAVLMLGEDYDEMVGETADQIAEVIGERAGLHPDDDPKVARAIRDAAGRLGRLLASMPSGTC